MTMVWGCWAFNGHLQTLTSEVQEPKNVPMEKNTLTTIDAVKNVLIFVPDSKPSKVQLLRKKLKNRQHCELPIHSELPKHF